MNKTTLDSKFVCCATCTYWSGIVEFKYPSTIIINQDNNKYGNCNNTYLGADVMAFSSCTNWKPRY